MSTTFIGWMGYGAGVTNNVLVEPADSAYSRHPLLLGDLNNGIIFNNCGGTVGPASTSWGSRNFAGVFDAVQGCNMLFWMPLERTVYVAASRTLTIATHSLRFLFPELRGGLGTTQTWPAGAVVAEVNGHLRATAGVMLQFVGGMFSASFPVLGSSITMANLPSNQPTAGSGQLWNNGGIIAVA